MDFGTREILILLGILVILAILLDGVRRVNNARRGKLRSGSRRSSRNPIFDDENDDYPNSELPGGRARVVQVRDEKSAEEISETLRRKADSAREKLTSVFRSRVEQDAAPAPEHDPDIFDAPATAKHSRPEAPLFADDDDHYGRIDDDFDGSQDFESPDLDDAERRAATGASAKHSPAHQDDEDEREDSFQPQIAPKMVPHKEARIEPDMSFRAVPPQERRHSADMDDYEQRADEAPRRQSSGRSAPSQDDILILHLMAHKGKTFEGEKLLEQILDQGLRYGSMKIFHRHENKDGSGPVHFSLANSVNPGTFDLNLIEQFASPGVTFIMPLDGLERPLESFDVLISTATTMAKKLDGELKDETRSALTKQTIEHYRQRIIDYTRRSFTLTN